MSLLPRVELIVQDLERPPSGHIGGFIYWTSEVGTFPEIGWYDTPLLLLESWLTVLIDPVADRATRRLEFREGPLALESRGLHGRVTLHGVDGSGRATIYVGSMSRADLLDSVLEAAQGVLEECRAKAWSGDDVKRLAGAAEAAKRALGRD